MPRRLSLSSFHNQSSDCPHLWRQPIPLQPFRQEYNASDSTCQGPEIRVCAHRIYLCTTAPRLPWWRARRGLLQLMATDAAIFSFFPLFFKGRRDAAAQVVEARRAGRGAAGRADVLCRAGAGRDRGPVALGEPFLWTTGQQKPTASSLVRPQKPGKKNPAKSVIPVQCALPRVGKPPAQLYMQRQLHPACRLCPDPDSRHQPAIACRKNMCFTGSHLVPLLPPSATQGAPAPSVTPSCLAVRGRAAACYFQLGATRLFQARRHYPLFTQGSPVH